MPRRTSMRVLVMVTLVGVAVLGTSLAQATTLASFADPTVGSSPTKYMFQVRDGAPGIIAEPAGAPMVTLDLDPLTGAGGIHPNVDLVFPQLSYAGGFMTGGSIGPGYFDFVEQGQSLLRIDFDSAYVTRSTLGGDDMFSASGVSFSVKGQPLLIDPGTGSFSFSFTNQKRAAAPASGFDATAAFTCSADVMPEPATITILAAGAGFGLVRRRR